MCKLGGSGIGGILGSLGGLGLDLFAPELGIPLALATGAGSFLGSTAGGLASGESPGKALLGGVESGALSGGLSGLGELATTGDFLGSLGGVGTAADAGIAGAASGVPGSTGTQLASAAPGAISDTLPAAPTAGASGIGGVASSAGAGGPADLTAINTAAVGSPSVAGGTSNALDTAAGFTPTGNASLDNLLSSFANDQSKAGIDAAIAADPTGTGTTSFASKLTDLPGDAFSFLKANPGLALGGGGMLASLLMNNSIPGIGALKSQEQLLSGLGAQNISAANTGQIPGGQQAQLDAAERAAEASTRSTFGREGISGSTMENQALVADKIAEAQAKNQIIQQIVNTGVAELGRAGTLASGIMSTELAQNKDVQDAIGKFAAALAGGSGLKAATS